jgi:tripartite-type tricarboxylate transporter receptor subunit TctC
MRAIAGGVCVCLAASLIAPETAAQSFPTKPIRLVVPFPPGGSNDIIARALAPFLAQSLGQNVIVDNRPGAGGAIGSDNVAKSPADGHTILIISSSFASNAAVTRTLPFDGAKDFAGVAQLGAGPFAVFVHPSLPVKDIQGLVVLAKRRTGEINYASSGTGGINHLVTEVFKRTAGINVVHVPYKGIAPAITDLVGGHVQMLITTMIAMPLARGGKLRALAVTGAKRSDFAPELPTVRESGIDYEVGVWFGVLAAAATPAPVLARLNAEIVRALATNELRERLAQEGSVPAAMAPAEFGAHVRNEIMRWTKVARAANIQID